MSTSDPIGDMLVRLRNGGHTGAEAVEMPHSRIKGEIARVLKREGFVADYVVEVVAKKVLRIYLKYGEGRRNLIRGMRRESRPGLRRYVGVSGLPRVLGGMGIAILSTPAGIMTDREARQGNTGGEYLCSVW